MIQAQNHTKLLSRSRPTSRYGWELLTATRWFVLFFPFGNNKWSSFTPKTAECFLLSFSLNIEVDFEDPQNTTVCFFSNAQCRRTIVSSITIDYKIWVATFGVPLFALVCTLFESHNDNHKKCHCLNNETHFWERNLTSISVDNCDWNLFFKKQNESSHLFSHWDIVP